MRSVVIDLLDIQLVCFSFFTAVDVNEGVTNAITVESIGRLEAFRGRQRQTVSENVILSNRLQAMRLSSILLSITREHFFALMVDSFLPL